MSGKRPPHVCGTMGDGDVCKLPAYHEGEHHGAHRGLRWPADPSTASQKGRENRSRDGSLAEEERATRARSATPAPRVHPWFREREPRRQTGE